MEEKTSRGGRVVPWLGAKVKNIVGLGELSVSPLPREIGVRVVESPAGSAAVVFGE